MKLNTVMPYKHKAQRYGFTIVQDPATLESVRQYYDAGQVAVTFVSASRRTPVIYSDVEWQINDKLEGVVDPSGVVVDDQTWYVTFMNPAVNALGYVDGYVYTLGKLPEQIS